MSSLISLIVICYCNQGFLENEQSDVSELIRVFVNPKEETFTWPVRDLNVDASQSYYIYELPEAGYKGEKTIKLVNIFLINKLIHNLNYNVKLNQCKL